jgi:hypothetical protein
MKGQHVAVLLALGLRKLNWKRWEKDDCKMRGRHSSKPSIGNIYIYIQ